MFRIFDLVAYTLERIWQHITLIFWVLLGITIATTLSLSLPLYVDSVYSGILSSRLDEPPFAFRFRYLGVWEGDISLNDAESATSAIEGRFAEDVAMPTLDDVRYRAAGIWNVRFAEENITVGNLTFATLQGAMPKINIVAGEWSPDDNADGERVELLLPRRMLFAYGVEVGDELVIQQRGGEPVEAVVAAMWQPVNEDDPAWIYPPKFFDEVMLVAPESFEALLADAETPVTEVGWYLNFDGSDLRTSEIDTLLTTIDDSQRQIDRVLPGVRMDVAPTDGLREFNEEVNRLTQQLFIIVLPVGGLVLYFVSLVAGLLVRRQQPEDVKLRSRGMSRRRVLAIHIMIWLLIVGVALGIAVGLGSYVVQLIGRTASFLNFTGVSSVNAVVITGEALLIAAVTGLVTASSGLFLAWRTTQQNINSYRQQQSTHSRRAWWQRAYLDIAAIIPAGYALYTLTQQQGIETSADTPFSDPLTFIGPTLFALGLTLLFLRVLPLLLGVLARALSLTSNIPLLMALRELTRSIGRYRGTLLMTAFTLSLTGFTASMASTLDRSLVDVINYRVGADVVLVTAADAQTETETDTETGQTTETVVGYNAPPVGQVSELDFVENLSRVGRYDGRLQVTGQQLTGTILGIDRAGIPMVTRYRDDFSDEALGVLMNKLAGNRTGIILSRDTAEEYGIGIGTELRYQVQALGEWQSEVRAEVLGYVEYFPTLDPAEEEFFLLTSIDPIFEISGTVLPYNVWLHVTPETTLDDVRAAMREISFPVLRYISPQQRLEEAQAEPARRGVLGFLSVGFVASIVLTLIGSVIQSVSSFRAQSAQLGSLRAMGLGRFSMSIYIIVLQGLIAISGILSGTAIGIGTTLLFLPLLDFSGGLPPYLVRVAWDEIIIVYGVFAGVLFLVTMVLSILLSREQLATAVKIGDV